MTKRIFFAFKHAARHLGHVVVAISGRILCAGVPGVVRCLVGERRRGAPGVRLNRPAGPGAAGPAAGDAAGAGRPARLVGAEAGLAQQMLRDRPAQRRAPETPTSLFIKQSAEFFRKEFSPQFVDYLIGIDDNAHAGPFFFFSGYIDGNRNCPIRMIGKQRLQQLDNLRLKQLQILNFQPVFEQTQIIVNQPIVTLTECVFFAEPL
jgi:hypothetical protein